MPPSQPANFLGLNCLSDGFPGVVACAPKTKMAAEAACACLPLRHLFRFSRILK